MAAGFFPCVLGRAALRARDLGGGWCLSQKNDTSFRSQPIPANFPWCYSSRMKKILHPGRLACMLSVMLLSHAGAAPDQSAALRSAQDSLSETGQFLLQTLPAKTQRQFPAQPVVLSTNQEPRVEIGPAAVNAPWPPVVVSHGFYNLLSQIAQAQAHDRKEPGFFRKFIAALAQPSPGPSPLASPFISGQPPADEELANEAKGNLNQLLSLAIATQLAHHYLGHSQKYAAQLAAGSPAHLVACGNLLSPAEWEETLKAGARNALETGAFSEASRLLLKEIDRMPGRPAWTVHFLPDKVAARSVTRDLEKFEAFYLAGKKF